MDHPALPIPRVADASVLLRPLTDDDAPRLVDAVDDPLIPKFTFWPATLSVKDARERVRRAEASRTAGTRLELAVAEPATSNLVGFIGLAPEWHDRRAEFFYWTAPWARRRGVASHALRLLSEWALRDLALERLELEVDGDNIASQSVAASARFQREGTLRSRRLRADGRCDSVMYGRLA